MSGGQEHKPTVIHKLTEKNKVKHTYQNPEGKKILAAQTGPHIHPLKQRTVLNCPSSLNTKTVGSRQFKPNDLVFQGDGKKNIGYRTYKGTTASVRSKMPVPHSTLYNQDSGNRYSRHVSDRRIVSPKPPPKGYTSNNSQLSIPKTNRNVLQSESLHLQRSTRNLKQNYSIKPVIPAKQAELLSVARAMNREEFATRLKKLFDPEREAAIEAIETGLYVGWRCPEFKHDCIRVGRNSKCFCGHSLASHMTKIKKSKHACSNDGCICRDYAFIPSRPEDIGEWWLPKRPGFDVKKWRAKCRCKHTHEDHNPNDRRQCLLKGCNCFSFDSNFLCCACDRHWEDHETFFDSADSRKRQGLPYGEYYLPFHEMPDLRNIVLTGEENNNNPYDAITSGPFAIPRLEPTPLARQLRDK